MNIPTVNDVPVVLISLLDQAVRRQDLVKNGVPAEWTEAFLEATDFRNKDILQLSPLYESEYLESRVGRKIRASEIGCALSHVKAAKWLASTKYEMALVIEDDILPAQEGWLDDLCDVIESFKSHARNGASFVCLLGARHDQADLALSRKVIFKERGNNEGIKYFLHADVVRSLWRAHAYLISRGAAERIDRNEAKILTLADDWNERRRLGLIDEIFYVRPILINQDEDRPSTIRPADLDDYFRPVIHDKNFITRVLCSICDGDFGMRASKSLTFRISKAIAFLNSFFVYRIG